MNRIAQGIVGSVLAIAAPPSPPPSPTPPRQLGSHQHQCTSITFGGSAAHPDWVALNCDQVQAPFVIDTRQLPMGQSITVDGLTVILVAQDNGSAEARIWYGQPVTSADGTTTYNVTVRNLGETKSHAL